MSVFVVKDAIMHGNPAKANRQKYARNAKARIGKQNAPSTTKAKGPPKSDPSFDIYKSPPRKFAMFSERLYGYTLGELEDIAGVLQDHPQESIDRIMAIVKRFKKQ